MAAVLEHTQQFGTLAQRAKQLYQARSTARLCKLPARKSSLHRGRVCASAAVQTVERVTQNGSAHTSSDDAYLTKRTQTVSQHFPNALGIDDFVSRVEVALHAFGFTGDNSIACVNLCRDEVTNALKVKLDQVFGSAFNTNGLGGVLSCGVTGMKAGLSHSPISAKSGKERYVFFSFPHIAIDATGEVGAINRPGRPGKSCACGAVAGALAAIKSDGVDANCKVPGVHEPLDPEFSIFKQRLARRMRYEGTSEDAVKKLDLVELTKIAERTITDDLEYLIKHAVDVSKADYAVVTGVQIHNWGKEFDDEQPNLEYVQPTTVYAVVGDEKTHLDLSAVPGLTPRQISILASQAAAASQPEELETACAKPDKQTRTKFAKQQNGERKNSIVVDEELIKNGAD